MTEIQQPETPPATAQQQVAPRKTLSPWVGVGIGCGAILLLGVILIALGVNQARKGIKKMPDKAVAVARQILDFELPGGERGVMGLNLGIKTAVVVSKQTDPVTVLMAFDFPLSWAKNVESSIREQIKQKLTEDGEADFKVSRTLTEPLNGRNVTIMVEEGTITSGRTPRDCVVFYCVVTNGKRLISPNLLVTGTSAFETGLSVFRTFRLK